MCGCVGVWVCGRLPDDHARKYSAELQHPNPAPRARARVHARAPVRVPGAVARSYTHREVEGAELIRASAGYTVPAEIARHVLVVGNLNHFPELRLPTSSSTSTATRTAAAADSTAAGATVTVPAPGAAAPGGGSWPNDCGSMCNSGLEAEKHITPAVLQQAYKLGPRPSGAAKGSIAVAEFTQVWVEPLALLP